MSDEATPPSAPLALILALAGETGARSAQELLGPLKAYLQEGTILFAHQSFEQGVPSLRGAALLGVTGGEVKVRRMLGRFDGLASNDVTFTANAHPAAELPHLRAVGERGWGVLRAAPQLVTATRWPASAADLPTLHRRLEATNWSGLLKIGDGGALWREGRVVAAHAEGTVGADALRTLRRAANEEGAILELHPLDPRTASSLHGVAERQRDSHKPAGSVHCDPDRTLFLGRNSVEFAVVGGSGFKGGFSAADRLASEPLHLPDEPIGWEGNRYAMTLRGRDALNPMTDRHTSFVQRFGERGCTLLEAVGSGEALDKVGRAAGIEFPELRKLVESWEGDGVVRRV
jgi:hypothetical protein